MALPFKPQVDRLRTCEEYISRGEVVYCVCHRAYFSENDARIVRCGGRKLDVQSFPLDCPASTVSRDREILSREGGFIHDSRITMYGLCIGIAYSPLRVPGRRGRSLRGSVTTTRPVCPTIPADLTIRSPAKHLQDGGTRTSVSRDKDVAKKAPFVGHSFGPLRADVDQPIKYHHLFTRNCFLGDGQLRE